MSAEDDAGSYELVVTDDLERSRLTTFFRFFLAIPHLLVLSVWGLVALLMAMINWFAIVFSGRTVGGDLVTRYVRYFTQVDAYINLAANPWPPFAGEPGYPVDVEITEQRRQNRWKTGFRGILALPAILLASAFGGSSLSFGGNSARFSLGLIAAGALLAWFAILARGRMPQGLRDLIVYGIGYSAQTAAYVLLVTDRYPDSDPLTVRYPAPAPDHVVRIRSDDDLERSRLTVLFRLLLWLPHLVWLLLWSVPALLAIVAQWFVTLLRGVPAEPLHRFLAAYVRYATHMTAYLYLVANPFPGFTGREGSYPVDLAIAGPERQNRWKTGFRLILAFPAALISTAVSNALAVVALFGWFVGLIRGRMPAGLQRLGVFALRYTAQLTAYTALLTDRYPFSGPSQELTPAPTLPPGPS